MSHTSDSNTSRSRRVRRVLLGTVFALGVGGLLAGQTFLPSTAALATTQPVASLAQPVSFADVVEKVQPAVVSIRVEIGGAAMARMENQQPEFPQGTPFDEFFRRFGAPGMPGSPEGRAQPHGMAQGSGFFITADGYAVTNNHVVENAEKVTVATGDGKEYSARVIGTDPKTDLALVKVDGRSDFPHVNFAKGESRVGDWVVAVGNPFGLGGSVTAGIVSARGRDIGAGPYDDFLQIDAPINKGNSGGPAFNLSGEVIGVNTAIFSPSGGSVGIGFAIPAATAEKVIADLKDDGQVVRGWLGVQIQPVTEDIAASIGLDDVHGALVSEPQPNSPALKAGLKAGDAILTVNGERIEDARALARLIAAYPPETAVNLGIWRNGDPDTVTVTLGQLPSEPRQASLGSGDQSNPTALDDFGLTLAPAAAVGAGDSGVVVTDIDPDGKAADKGLRQGDVILEVAGNAVERPADVQRSIVEAGQDGRKAVLMRVKTGDQIRFVALTLDRA